jgi:hypothetical protein
MRPHIRFAVLLTGALALTGVAHARESVPDWSVGVGLGLLSAPMFSAAYFPSGFVTLERKLSDSVALDAMVAGHYAGTTQGSGAYSAVGQLAVGPRLYFIADQLVRPSVFAHATGSHVRLDAPGMAELKSTAYGGVAGLGLDADLSEAVVLRFESPIAYLQRASTVHEQERHGTTYFGLGLAPRAELRIGW